MLARVGCQKCTLAEVRAYPGEAGIEYHVGRFPESEDDRVRAMRFSVVHLDVDLYQSTARTGQLSGFQGPVVKLAAG